MSERKNIDRLFQEKFKDFEANPADEVWGNIETKLNEKKRKRVIPFWWKLSGIAALLAIGFLITKSVSNNDIAPINPIVTEENSNQSKDKTNPKELENKNKKSNTPLNSENDNAITNSNNVVA